MLEKYKDKIEYERVGPVSLRTLKNNTEQSSLRTSLSIVRELSWRAAPVADRIKKYGTWNVLLETVQVHIILPSDLCASPSVRKPATETVMEAEAIIQTVV